MKSVQVTLALVLLLIISSIGIVSADTDLVASTIVNPSPVVAGSSVFIYSELTYTASGSTAVSICIPDDWATQATLNAVTPSSSIGATWSTGTTATGTTVSGVTLICSSYTTDDATLGWDAAQWEFTVQSSATVGANRPVQVRQFPADGGVGSPYLQTVFTTVQGAPSTRYVGNTLGDCAGNTPCDTGITGLQDAINALPALGGTIVISGEYLPGGASIGSKDIVLQALDGSSELRADPTCAGHIELDSTGNLTIDSLTVDGTGICNNGLIVNGNGNLTVQNSSNIDNWLVNGIYVGGTSSSNVAVNNSSFDGNSIGLHLASINVTVSVDNSSFTNHNSYAIFGINGDLTVEDSTFSSNSTGIHTTGTLLARGNTFNNNTGYGLEIASGGNATAYANSFSGNYGGGYQAYVQDIDDAAKNWWGSYSDSNVGPTTDGSTSYADGWDRRLGAAVLSWAAGADNVALGDAQLNRTGGSTADGVIISFGRSSANAPFGNGVPPYVNLACSPFYDFYALGSPTNWRVSLPIDNTPDCNSNVLAYEIAYTITDIADCTTANNTACWDPISPDDVLVNSNTLLIDNLDLSGTHTVAGDSSGGLDPTAVNLLDVNIAQNQPIQLVGFAIILLGLAFTGIIVWRRKTQS